MVASLSLLTVALLLLAHTGIGDLRAAMAGAAACGLFLLGPYSLVGGAITLDVAGTKAASTCAGIVDGMGYVGASLSGVVIGAVAQSRGWGAAFDVVAAVSFTATIVSLVWWIVSRRARTPAPA
jgi:sugar phosphate permease